jgi:hypothetical protein
MSPETVMSPAVKKVAQQELQRLFLQYAHMDLPEGGSLGELAPGDATMDVRELTRFATAVGIVPAFVRPAVLKEIFEEALSHRQHRTRAPLQSDTCLRFEEFVDCVEAPPPPHIRVVLLIAGSGNMHTRG